MKLLKRLAFAFVALATLASCSKDGTPADETSKIQVSSAKIEAVIGGEAKELVITAPSDWTITGTPEWAVIKPALTGGEGETTLEITFEANTGNERTAEITISLDDESGSTKVTLSQAGKVVEKIDYTATHMVEVVGGTFEMSAEYTEIKDKKPDPFQNRHKVTLSDFMIGKYEVTQELWKKVMGTEPYIDGGTKPETTPPSGGFEIEGGAAVYITWIECIQFCNKLSELEKLAPYYTVDGLTASIVDVKGKGYRLPTESEWEYAARGGSKSAGYELSGGDLDYVDDFAWTGDNTTRVEPVGKLTPNELGLHDMSGNAWEQVWDFYGKYPTELVVDPQGPAAGIGAKEEGVMRGGSWYGNAGDNPYYPFRPEVRLPMDRSLGDDDRGFRIAKYK